MSFSSSYPPVNDELSNSSLRDLLKICRSHSLQLPASLPEDKQYYIDLIRQHRAAIRAAQEDIVAASASSGSGSESESGHEGFVRVPSSKHFPSMSILLEGKEIHEAGVQAVAAASSSASSFFQSASSSLTSASSSLLSSSSSSLAPPQPVEPSSAPLEYDEDEEEFVRSPLVQKITSILQNIALFDFLEAHTSIPRFYWSVLLVLILAIGIFLWIGPLAVANFICFVYPAYRTFKTLEGKFLQQEESIEGDHSIEVHRFWLTYWVVYGLFRVLEYVADFFFYKLSYYHPLKIVFLVWCFHPSTCGCSYVYAYVIRPLFLPREEQIDQLIYKIHTSIAQTITEVKGIIVRKVAKRIAGDADDTPAKPPQQREKIR